MNIKSLVYPCETPKYINDFDTWKLYQSVRLHFMTDSYRLEKYNFSSKKAYNWEKYQKVSMWEVKLFDKWAKHFLTDNNVKMALGAHFFYNKPAGSWECAPDHEDVQEAYSKLKSFLYSPKYFLENDLTKLNESYTISILKATNDKGEVAIPKIYHLAHKGIISYETLAMIDISISLTKYTCTKLNTLTWDAYKDWYLKYRPFVCLEMDKEYTDYIREKLLLLKNN